MNWGGSIQAAREAKGWTRRGLAQRLDVAEVTVWRWETGQTTPESVYLLRLAQVLEVSTETLFPIPVENPA